MRILHIVGTIDPAAGGPTEAIRMLIRYAPSGFVAEVATLDRPNAPFLKDMPFTVHALGTKRGSWWAPRFVPWLRRHARRFDGVIVHGLWEYTGLGTMLALGGRVPYMVFVHGMLDPWFKHTYPAKHRKKQLYWLLAESWVLCRAFRVLFTTALERDLAAQSFRWHHWHALVVPLGSERPPEPAAELRRHFAQRWPALAGKRLLLFLGRLHPKKGCDLLLQAFSQVSAAHPELHLVMAGPDPTQWQQQLESTVPPGLRSRVHWPGMLRGRDKWAAFAACEAFVLPSHQENFGIAAVEALASGKPVLLARPVNIAPDLEAAGCALVEDDTAEGTLRLLARWLALSDQERAAMAERASAAFEEHYQMRHNAESILRAFQQPAPEAAAPQPNQQPERT